MPHHTNSNNSRGSTGGGQRRQGGGRGGTTSTPSAAISIPKPHSVQMAERARLNTQRPAQEKEQPTEAVAPMLPPAVGGLPTTTLQRDRVSPLLAPAAAGTEEPTTKSPQLPASASPLSTATEGFLEEDDDGVKGGHRPSPLFCLKYTLVKLNAEDVETNTHRINQRRKQISFGYNTEGYRHYSKCVARHNRQYRNPNHPVTPRDDFKCAKRAWDNTVAEWRRALHMWDGEPNPASMSVDGVQSLGTMGYEPVDGDMNALYTDRSDTPQMLEEHPHLKDMGSMTFDHAYVSPAPKRGPIVSPGKFFAEHQTPAGKESMSPQPNSTATPSSMPKPSPKGILQLRPKNDATVPVERPLYNFL